MAETMAGVVALTSKFQQQMEARDKRETEKDAQIAALMQQMQRLAEATTALTAKVNAGTNANSSMMQVNGWTRTPPCMHPL